MSKSKLGRGLSNLLDTAMDEKGKVIELSISKIHPNPWQPRRDFDEESLSALAASIKEKGLIQPITVRNRENDGASSMSWSPANGAFGRRSWRGSR